MSCQGGEFGEDPGQEIVQSVDGLSRLLDLRPKTSVIYYPFFQCT